MEDIDWKRQYRLLEETFSQVFISLEDSLARHDTPKDVRVPLAVEELSSEVIGGEARVVTTTSGPAAQYAFYVYANDVRQHVTSYSPSNTHTFAVAPGSRYRVRGFARKLSKGEEKPVEATIRFEV